MARALHVLGIAADTAKLNAFVAGCRRTSGGYASSPAPAAATLVDTYFALTIDHWINPGADPTN